jgi:MFS family permease
MSVWSDIRSSNMDCKSISCVIGAILINLTLGTFYSIGNVGPYLASYMRENGNPQVTSEHATWITATFLLGQGIFIIVGSYIERCYDSRVACILGCLLHCVSTFMTMWAINVNIATVILIYGFGSGLGCGSAYMAAIIAAQKWFPARKGLFTGIIVAGFGFGGLIFTNLQTLYLNPNNVPPDPATGYFDQKVHGRVPSLFLYMGIIFTVVQSIGCTLAFPPPTSGNSSEGSATQQRQPATTVYDDMLPNMTGTMSAFRYKIFYIIGLMMMLVAPGVTFVNSLGKRYGQTYITSDRYLATVVAVAAISNASGRLTWGYLVDKLSFSTCFLIKVLLFSVLIATFPFEFVLQSETCFMVWMLGLSFGFSGTFVLFPVFIEQVFGSQYHGVIYGILYILLATSSIVTAFVIQVVIGPALADKKTSVKDKALTRMIPCWGVAAAYLLSYTIFFLSLPIRRIDTAIRRRQDAELSKRRAGGLANRADLLGAAGPQSTDNPQASDGSKVKSLGSIVRFSDAPLEIDKTKLQGRSWQR